MVISFSRRLILARATGKSPYLRRIFRGFITPPVKVNKNKQTNRRFFVLNRSIMFFTFEFLCLSNFVSFVFCFYSSDCFFFFLIFFKVVHSFLIFSFTVVAAVDIHVGHVRLLLIEATVKLWDAIIQRLDRSPLPGASNFHALVPWHFHGPVYF